MYDITAAYLNEIGKKKKFTPKEEKDIFARLKAGEDVRNEIIERNLRLVVSIAKKFKNTKMALLDRIQEGTLGLMDAVDKFDFKLGNRFSTYATYRIWAFISNANRKKWQEIYVPELPYYSDEPRNSFISKDAIIGEDLIFQDTMDDKSQSIKFEKIETSKTFWDLWNQIDDLKPITKRCLELKFMYEMTLQFIGDEYGYTRARIGQIIDHGLRSLRARRKNPIFKELKEL